MGVAIDISSCLPISGWMSELELTWLAEQASKSKRIIEVGSWCGRSTRALLLYTSGTVWCVDTWESLLGGETDVETRKAALKAYMDFMANTVEFRYPVMPQIPKLRVLKIDSIEAAKTLWIRFGGVFDMVFLDGAHDYERVAAEIPAYMQLVKTLGMLCGHDIGHADVNRAVRELVPDYQVVPDTQLWFTIKHGNI